MSNIQVISLTTGEQLLTEVSDRKDEQTTVRKPAILVPAGEGKIGLAPYAPYTDVESIVINNTNIVWFSDAVEDLANEYRSAFGSGIVSVPAGAVGGIPDLKITD